MAAATEMFRCNVANDTNAKEAKKAGKKKKSVKVGKNHKGAPPPIGASEWEWHRVEVLVKWVGVAETSWISIGQLLCLASTETQLALLVAAALKFLESVTPVGGAGATYAPTEDSGDGSDGMHMSNLAAAAVTAERANEWVFQIPALDGDVHDRMVLSECGGGVDNNADNAASDAGAQGIHTTGDVQAHCAGAERIVARAVIHTLSSADSDDDTDDDDETRGGAGETVTPATPVTLTAAEDADVFGEAGTKDAEEEIVPTPIEVDGGDGGDDDLSVTEDEDAEVGDGKVASPGNGAAVSASPAKRDADDVGQRALDTCADTGPTPLYRYLVKWHGQSYRRCTWEDESILESVPAPLVLAPPPHGLEGARVVVDDAGRRGEAE